MKSEARKIKVDVIDSAGSILGLLKALERIV